MNDTTMHDTAHIDTLHIDASHIDTTIDNISHINATTNDISITDTTTNDISITDTTTNDISITDTTHIDTTIDVNIAKLPTYIDTNVHRVEHQIQDCEKAFLYCLYRLLLPLNIFNHSPRYVIVRDIFEQLIGTMNKVDNTNADSTAHVSSSVLIAPITINNKQLIISLCNKYYIKLCAIDGSSNMAKAQLLDLITDDIEFNEVINNINVYDEDHVLYYYNKVCTCMENTMLWIKSALTVIDDNPSYQSNVMIATLESLLLYADNIRILYTLDTDISHACGRNNAIHNDDIVTNITANIRYLSDRISFNIYNINTDICIDNNAFLCDITADYMLPMDYAESMNSICNALPDMRIMSNIHVCHRLYAGGIPSYNTNASSGIGESNSTDGTSIKVILYNHYLKSSFYNCLLNQSCINKNYFLTDEHVYQLYYSMYNILHLMASLHVMDSTTYLQIFKQKIIGLSLVIKGIRHVRNLKWTITSAQLNSMSDADLIYLFILTFIEMQYMSIVAYNEYISNTTLYVNSIYNANSTHIINNIARANTYMSAHKMVLNNIAHTVSIVNTIPRIDMSHVSGALSSDVSSGAVNNDTYLHYIHAHTIMLNVDVMQLSANFDTVLNNIDTSALNASTITFHNLYFTSSCDEEVIKDIVLHNVSKLQLYTRLKPVIMYDDIADTTIDVDTSIATIAKYRIVNCYFENYTNVIEQYHDYWTCMFNQTI